MFKDVFVKMWLKLHMQAQDLYVTVKAFPPPSCPIMVDFARILEMGATNWLSIHPFALILYTLTHWNNAALRTGSYPEGDATAGDGSGSPAVSGGFNGAGGCGERHGESWRETLALCDDQTQPETPPRIILFDWLLRGSEHPHGRCRSLTSWRRRGEAHCAEEGHAEFETNMLWFSAVMERTYDNNIIPIMQLELCYLIILRGPMDHIQNMSVYIFWSGT